MSIKNCPNCRLIVDERHQFCTSCGYDWNTQRVLSSMSDGRSARVAWLPWAVLAVVVIWFFGWLGP